MISVLCRFYSGIELFNFLYLAAHKFQAAARDEFAVTKHADAKEG